MDSPLVIGAVAYTANVVPIWEGIRDYFAPSKAPMDFVLFSNYSRQVDALLAGHIDIAWNTNLAWVRTVMQTSGGCRALAMRDIDRTFHTVFVGREGAGLDGPESLRGRHLVLGSRDSAQAAILPVHYLEQAGLGAGNLQITRINSDIGKHGDTGRSELDALELVIDGRADVAAIGNTTWAAMGRDQLVPGLTACWRTPEYFHCNFTALDHLPAERTDPWVEHLMAMDWENPEHRPILELEGLKQWMSTEGDGYASLFEAVAAQGISARW